MQSDLLNARTQWKVVLSCASTLLLVAGCATAPDPLTHADTLCRMFEPKVQWRMLESPPSDVQELRALAYKGMSIQPETLSPPMELWYEAEAGRRLLCRPGGFGTCGHIKWHFHRDGEEWVTEGAQMIHCD
jgi:hypothetical protein